MTSVCKWLGFYLCMKEPTAVAEKHGLTGIHGGHYKCDMLITLRAVILILNDIGSESRESTGGLAFDVILKPALLDNPPPVLMRTHSPSKELSQEDIDKKLKEAEDRRLAMESQKLLSVQKSRERAAEASQRIQDLNDSFMRDAEKKLLEKMEVSMEKKTTQIKQLQERLREHAQRVEMIKKMGEESRVELKERIDKKLETAGEKRELQLGKVQERIRQHQRHIEEVIECSSRFSRDTEERIIQKMECSLKNREEHLNNLLERLKKHAQHADEIRMNKLNASNTEDSIGLLEDYNSDDDDDDDDDEEEEERSTEEYQNTHENFGADIMATDEKFSEADKGSYESVEASTKGSRDVSDDEDDSVKSFEVEEKGKAHLPFVCSEALRSSN